VRKTGYFPIAWTIFMGRILSARVKRLLRLI